MTWYIAYQSRGNIEYARLQSNVYREDGKRIKNYQNLGRVIDKEKGIFKSRERGIFTFNLETMSYGAPEEEHVPPLAPRRNARPQLILNFGDVYFLDLYTRQIGFDKCINDIGYGNIDTIKTMLMFYMVRNRPNSSAEVWYESSYAKIIYPKANINSQRISDFLESIGNESRWRKFFSSYLAWLQEVNKDNSIRNILIDSTGLPNSIHFPLTAISNHNGKISNEVRLIYVVHRDSGMPIYMRYCPGNVIDTSTIKRTILELKQNKIDVDWTIFDAGYYSSDNVDTLFDSGINFITRLQENRKIYKELINKYEKEIFDEKYLVLYGSRYLFVKQVDCKLKGINNEYDAHAYIIKDIARARDEEQRIMFKGASERIEGKDLFKDLIGKGFFILVSSVKVDINEILPLYYTRQQIEQVFDICKNYSNILPLRVHSEEKFRGHLLLTFMATAIFRMLQILMKDKKYDPLSALEILETHKCTIHPNLVITSEPFKKAREVYELIGIACPAEVCIQTGLEN